MKNMTVVTIKVKDPKTILTRQKELEEVLRKIEEIKKENPNVEFHIEVSNFTTL